MSGMTHESRSPRDTVELMELLRRQRDSYRDLRRLAERQRRLISEDHPGDLLLLLAQRQKLTREIVEMGQQLAPARQSWSATRESLDPAERREAEQMLAEASGLLGRIIADDEQDARLLAARKTQTAAAIEAARADRQAVVAYAATEGRLPRRLDQLSEES